MCSSDLSSTSADPSHTYAAAGTYTVSETVTDSVSGKTSTATKSVTLTSSTGGDCSINPHKKKCR